MKPSCPAWFGRLLWALLLAAGLAATLHAQQPPPERLVVTLRVAGPIGPAAADFIRRGIEHAERRGARLVVIELDTPGGLDSSMRAIVQNILAAPVPVATFVAPEGARAASAGTFIVYASHVAAMAPATTLGAATPVAVGAPGAPAPRPPAPQPAERPDGKGAADRPEVPADPRMAKAIRDAAAYLRGLAQLRGRNADFAEQAVLRAASLSSEEALEGGVIDVLAADVPDLLRQIDGRKVKLAKAEATLAVAGANVETIEPDWRNRLLALLSTPTVALALMMIGIYGLFIEFTSPGFGVPGVAGAICLLLGLYALHMLPVNWIGAGLLLLGTVLMIAEVFIPRFGVLGVGGIIAFVLGGLMLFDPAAVPGFDIPAAVIITLALVSAALIFAVGGFAMRARARPAVSGTEELLGTTATIVSTDADGAWADVRGERWRVRCDAPLAIGDRVRVNSVDGLTLVAVRKD
jgi:membrane-bound serine protease (ClpP class)